MAVLDGTPNEALTDRLNHLLRRARATKHSTAIDPPLQVSALVDDNERLIERIGEDKEVHMLAIETAAKSVFYANLGSTRIDEPSFVTVWNLLDILQYLGDRELCGQQLVLHLVEELLDSLSISGCRIAFRFLESRREAIIANKSQNKDLVILRLCNELLRRLSRAEDPVFCGRVYIFLFQSFPLGDKSSVNLRGNFHVENVTTFEDFLKTSTPAEDAMQMETSRPVDSVKGETKAEDLDAKPTDSDKATEEKTPTLDIDTLYPVFWSLQHSFSNPPRLFDEENFKQFQKGLEATLAKFKEVPKIEKSAVSAQTTTVHSRSDDNYDEFASAFNPKYLTSRDLFKLELSDLAFQRHILVQALILIDFLLTLTETSKSQPYYQNAQKAMQYGFTLREEDTQWALGIKESIANYLQQPPDGKFYYRMVDTVLSRDKNWVRWKMENCQPFTRDRVPTENFVKSKSLAQTAASTRKPAKLPPALPHNLLFLDPEGKESKLSQLRQPARFPNSSVESYGQEIRTAELDLEMARSEEEKRQLDEKLDGIAWRGFRRAAKDQLNSKFDKNLFQPVKSSMEATGVESAPTAPEDRDLVPQEDHPSVEERRAG